jgi:hypothetical protein
MNVPGARPQVIDFFGMPTLIEPSPGQLAGDAALLHVRPFDQRLSLTRAFAEALDDPRDPGLTEHPVLEMVRSRAYGILADQNDHETLRTDPTFRLVADRSPEKDDLASQPTLYRFGTALSIQSLRHLPWPRDRLSAPAQGRRQQVSRSVPASAAPKAMPARGLERRPPENSEYHDIRSPLARGFTRTSPPAAIPGSQGDPGRVGTARATFRRRGGRMLPGAPGRPAPGQHEHQHQQLQPGRPPRQPGRPRVSSNRSAAPKAVKR